MGYCACDGLHSERILESSNIVFLSEIQLLIVDNYTDVPKHLQFV